MTVNRITLDLDASYTRTIPVKEGDTLWDIARTHGVSLETLFQLNPQFDPTRADGIQQTDRSSSGGWDPDYLQPGDKINLPAKSSSQTSHTVPVKEGDTLWDIARTHGVSLETLFQLNPQFDPTRADGIKQTDRSSSGGWDPDYLQPGDKINLPAKSSSQTSGTQTQQPTQNNQSPTVTPTPTVQPTPTPTVQPTPTATPATTNPSQPGPLPFIPYRGFVPQRMGFGMENAWHLQRGTGSFEPYAKFSWASPVPWLDFNLKVKYTPRATVTFLTPPTGAANAQTPSFLRSLRHGGWKAERLTIDVGLVFGKRHEVGWSGEWTWKKDSTSGAWTRPGFRPTDQFGYVTEKAPGNILVDVSQAKIGKVPFSAVWRRDWAALNRVEVSFAAEKSAFTGALSQNSSLLGTGNVKTTVGQIREAARAGETPSTNWRNSGAPGFRNFAGFTAGTAASFGGSALADNLIGKYIPNSTARYAVNAAGGAAVGVAADAVVTHVASKVKMPAAVTNAATRISQSANPVAQAVSKIPLGATGRVLGKVARVGGPAGAVLAGVPDGVDAYKHFSAGNTAEGWKSVGRAAVRVGATAVGAALGSALIPIPGVGTVVGGVVGGVVGDALAKLF